MNPYLVNRKKGESYTGISIEYRMYPNQLQERYLSNLGNKLRGAYNLLVATYVKGKDYKDIIKKNKETQKEVYDLLTKTEWLKDEPSIFVAQVSVMFFTALENFRKNKKRPPNFKKKTNLLSITSNNNGIKKYKFDWENNVFKMWERILERKNISSEFKVVFHEKFQGATLKNISINRKSDGKWYVSMSLDASSILQVPKPIKSEKVVGIDIGIKDMAITSDGKKFQVPVNEIKKLENKIDKINKEISRKQLLNKCNFESRNYRDLLKRKGRIQQRINNLRKQAHRHTTTILTKGEVGQIKMEDIKLGFMLKNEHLSRSTSRIGINSFTQNLKSVSNTKGIELVFVNPRNTSKTCSDCGHIYKGLKLKHRSWVCENCGVKHDRDVNAAKNIQKSLEITK